jgi:hypothetical protein
MVWNTVSHGTNCSDRDNSILLPILQKTHFNADRQTDKMLLVHVFLGSCKAPRAYLKVTDEY